MTAVLDEHTQFVDTAGSPVVGGNVYFGTAGADPKLNPISIFSDRALTVALANPQTTDALGRVTNKVWLDGKYSMRVTDSADVQIYQELDNGVDAASTAVVGLTSVAGANTITAVSGLSLTAYNDCQVFIFGTVSANTGAVTLNVDAVGAKAIVKNNDEPLENADFDADMKIEVIYNLANDNFEWANQKTGLDRDTTPQAAGPIDMNSHMDQWSKGADVASAAALPVLNDGNYFDVTGTTTITSIATFRIGTVIRLQFDGALTITHNAATLALLGSANITTVAGDVATFVQDGASLWRMVGLQREDGTSPFGPAFTSTGNTITSAGQLVLAHGLSAAPRRIFLYILCGTAELGYSIGDLLGPNNFEVNGSGNRGVSIVADATNITIRFGAATGSLSVLTKDTGLDNNITNTSWTLEVRAYP